MQIDTKQIIAITEANQNFSKVVRMVDEKGMVLIAKNNKPKYILVSISEYEEIQAYRQEKGMLYEN